MFAYGIIIALITLALDQYSKYWMMVEYALPARGTVEITSFFNLVTVWNTGVSFGMFNEMGADNATILIVFAAVLTAVLLGWLWRAQHRLLAGALGLVVGGALGNIIDRVQYGAVFDFLDIHAMGYHWPAFNIADAAICVGVGLILLDGFICNDSTSPSQPS